MADAASVPRPPPRDNTGDEESDVSGGSTGTPSKAGNRGRGSKRPRAARTASAGRAPRSHVATEQRRRDRINDGFDQLRDLIPHKDKLDKAAFLQKTIDYICQLQGVLQQLLDMGVVSTLSDDLQWTIRMLLPRQVPGGRPVGTRPDGNPPSALFGPPACGAVSGGNTMSSGGPPLPQMQRQAPPQPQPVQQAAPQQVAPQQAAPGADSAQVQYIQSLLSTMPPAQLHTMVAQAMTGQTQQQQQQIHHPAPQQPQAPEPARPIASPWMAQLTSAAPSAAAAAGSMAGAMDPANFQQLAAWISATSQQQQQQQPVQPPPQQQQQQAASQASGESGGNTNLPSWAHLTQLAQALQQQSTARGGQAAAPSPLGFMRPPANNS